jgi:DNA damage checkpoint protein
MDIPSDYKQEFYNQPSEYFNSENKVNYIMIDQSIPKNFLDMVPSSTEDFKIEFKGEKLTFAGYTKQVVKDKEYLKQPMSVSIVMSLHDLFSSNLIPSPRSTQSADPPRRQSINFRIKEFRNFINICNSVDNDTPFDIYFKNPGDPIVFEFSHQNILIQYIQITADDDKSSSHGNSSTLGSTVLSLDELTSRKLSMKLQKRQRSENRSILAKAIPDSGIQTQTPNSVRGNRSETPVNNPTPSSEAGDDFVTYGREHTPQEIDHSNKRQKTSDFSILPNDKINDPDTEYSESSEEIDEAMLGPTQMNNKPKSIFD